MGMEHRRPRTSQRGPTACPGELRTPIRSPRIRSISFSVESHRQRGRHRYVCGGRSFRRDLGYRTEHRTGSASMNSATVAARRVPTPCISPLSDRVDLAIPKSPPRCGWPRMLSIRLQNRSGLDRRSRPLRRCTRPDQTRDKTRSAIPTARCRSGCRYVGRSCRHARRRNRRASSHRVRGNGGGLVWALAHDRAYRAVREAAGYWLMVGLAYYGAQSGP